MLVDRLTVVSRSGWKSKPCVLLLLLAACAGGCGSGLFEYARDTDADGLSDEQETRLGLSPVLADTDGDGLADGAELAAGTSPLVADSDRDGLPDADEAERDLPPHDLISASSGNDIEPNNMLMEAVVLAGADPKRRSFEGEIYPMVDVDVFELGSLARGDRVVVDFERRSEALHPVVVLLDVDGEVIAAGRDGYTGPSPDLPGLIDVVTRQSCSTSYFAVAAREDSTDTGGYRFHLTITPDTPVPSPEPQVVFLDFDGTDLPIPLMDLRQVEPFDASAIDARYTGYDDEIKASIVATFVDRYADYQIVVYTSDGTSEEDLPADFTRLSFGSDSSIAFGVSVSVDPYNEDPCDNGIIFTETFTPMAFGFPPAASALGVAIGQVAAHEAGHLLGLRHVDDARALMDRASSPVSLLTEQIFKTARVASDVFPLGIQNAPVLLEAAVGRH